MLVKVYKFAVCSCVTCEEIITFFFREMVFKHLIFVSVFSAFFFLSDAFPYAFIGIVGFKEIKVKILRVYPVKGICISTVQSFAVIGHHLVSALRNVVLQQHGRDRHISVSVLHTRLIHIYSFCGNARIKKRLYEPFATTEAKHRTFLSQSFKRSRAEMVCMYMCEQHERNAPHGVSERLVRYAAVHEYAVINRDRVPRRTCFYDIKVHLTSPYLFSA